MNYLSSSPARTRSYFPIRSYSNCSDRNFISRFRAVRPAFTLVEMLVVITIITVLLTIGALGLRNLSKSSGVSAGVPLAEASFAEARGVSSGSGGTSRVLINADPDDEERYLRYIMVVYLSEGGKWVAAGRGTYLPKGVYFSQVYSKLDHSASSGDIPKLTAADRDIYSGPDSTTRNENLSGEYFFYQFNSEGNASAPGASFVVGTGSKPPGADNPKVATGSGVSNFGGFIVWAKGTTSIFRHPEQINIPSGISSGDEF